jgi:flagellar protein FlaG
MSQISVSAVSSSPVPSSEAQVGQAPADRSLNRAVSVAVGKLNASSYAGEGREVTFSVDPGTKQPVVKVIDTATREVIRQLPPEYLLQIADDNATNGRDSG